MKFIKLTLITTVLIASAGFVSAEELNIPDSTTAIEETTQTVEAPAPTPETITKIDQIKTALKLSTEEITDLKASLIEVSSLDVLSTEHKAVTHLLNKLAAHSAWYTEKLEEIETNPPTDVEAAKVLAKKIIEYRGGEYATTVEEASDLFLFLYSSDALNLASARLIKITTDIQKLESLKLITAETFKTKLSEAELLIAEATKLQTEIKPIIVIEPVVVENIDGIKPIEEAVNLVTPPVEEETTTNEATNEELVAEDEEAVETTVETEIIDTEIADTESNEEITAEDEQIMLEEQIATVDPTESETKEALVKILTNIKSSYQIFLEVSSEIKTGLKVR